MAALPADGRRRIVAALIVLPLCLALIWFSWSFTHSILMSAAMPERALATMRTAPALAARSSTLLTTGKLDQQRLDKARALAIEALRREPGNVAAVRTLGLIEGVKDNRQAKQLMLHAQRLSRRDSPAQLWLMEDAVRENSVPRALIHYDRVLSTSFSSRDLLLPILVKATSEPDIAERVSRRMAERPNWWEKAITRFVEESEDAPSLALVVGRLRLNPDVPTERSYLTAGLARLVSRGGIVEAARIAARARPTSAPVSGPATDRFAQDAVLPPFDWGFSPDPDLSAARVADGQAAGGFRLEVTAGEGKAGPVASRLLMLKPGVYRLSSVVGGEREMAGALTFTIACQGRTKGSRTEPIATIKGNATGTFTVRPTGCEGQWLSVVKDFQRNYDASGEGAWVREIRIERAS